MAMVYERALEQYKTMVTLGMGTCEEGEALTLLLCSQHRNIGLNTQCPLCDIGPETTRHLWECLLQPHKWRPA